MGIIFSILLFIHVIVCLLLVLLVLMQRPKQEGLGAAFASGMMSDSFGAQTTDVLQKGTQYLAVMFFVLSLSMAAIKARENKARYAPPTDMSGALEEIVPGTSGEPTPAGNPVLPVLPVESTPDAPAEDAAATQKDEPVSLPAPEPSVEAETTAAPEPAAPEKPSN